MKKTGELLAERIKQEGMSQMKLSDEVGVSRAMLSAIATGKAALPVAVAARIGQVLGLGFGEELLIAQAGERKARDLALYNELVKEQQQ